MRDELGLSKSALPKQLSTIEEAGYAAIEGALSDGRRRVQACLKPVGRKAFDGTAPHCAQNLGPGAA
jgi:DNA-binding MarR family transcriptional regulator